MTGCICELLICLNGFILNNMPLLGFERQCETDIYVWQSWIMYTVDEEEK
jgi:hypothetical protein